VIGIGGITCAEDAIEFLIVGASAVQIGTFKFIDPSVMEKIIQGIGRYLVETGSERLSDIIGTFSTK